MDFGVLIEAMELVATQPGFDFLQTVRDIGAVKSLVEAIKAAGKLDVASLTHSGVLGPAIDAVARLSPILAKVKNDPKVGSQVMSLLASIG